METQIWAHRGASGYAPENTLEAFALAVKQKADGVELDIQLTKDGEIVVIHDETIDRVSNGKGKVRDYTLKELKAFIFNKTHPEYTLARIPTLREVYQLLRPYKMTINVELKNSIYFYPGMEEKVLKLTKEMDMEEYVWYSSFNHLSLRKIKELDNRVRTGILYADILYDAPSYAKWLGADALHPSMNYLQYPGFLETCKKSGQPVHVWTVNKETDIKEMRELGVDAIITNYPDRARLI